MRLTTTSLSRPRRLRIGTGPSGEVLQEELAARGLMANALALKLRFREPPDRILDGKRGICPTPPCASADISAHRRLLAQLAEPVRSGAGGEAVWAKLGRGRSRRRNRFSARTENAGVRNPVAIGRRSLWPRQRAALATVSPGAASRRPPTSPAPRRR